MSEATRPGKRRLGVADLVAYLTQPGRTLSPAEKRELISSVQLQSDLRRLRSELAVCAVPRLAAASTSARFTDRAFEGGRLRIHPSNVGRQSYVLVQFDDPMTSPVLLTLEGSDGQLTKRALPKPDDQGRMLLVLDTAEPGDAEFLRLVGDPLSQGAFMR
jgi:hypothetical protein